MEDQKVIESDPLASVTPCRHMTGLLNRFADGTLKGMPLAYTRYHARHCPQCNRTVSALRQLISRLGDLRSTSTASMSEEQWHHIEDGWNEVENLDPVGSSKTKEN